MVIGLERGLAFAVEGLGLRVRDHGLGFRGSVRVRSLGHPSAVSAAVENRNAGTSADAAATCMAVSTTCNTITGDKCASLATANEGDGGGGARTSTQRKPSA